MMIIILLMIIIKKLKMKIKLIARIKTVLMKNSINGADIISFFPKKKHYGNIGSNFVVCKKHVIGVKNGIYAVISMILLEIGSFIVFVVVNQE